MIKFIVGVIVGIVLATVGVSGISYMLDYGVNAVRTTAQDAARHE